MLDNSLTKLFEIRLSPIEEYLLSIKPEFVEKFGLDLWDKIVSRNGIPLVIKYPDDVFYYIREKDDIIVKKRFNTKTWSIEYLLPSKVTIDTYISSAYITKRIIHTENYKWVMGVKEIFSNGGIVGDYLNFD